MRAKMELLGFSESSLSSLGEERRDSRVERRIIACRMVAAGKSAPEVGAAVGVDERTVRVWVKEFNRDGIESLRYGRYKGAKPHLPAEYEVEVIEAIRRGPPESMGITVWRGWAVRRWLEEEYGVKYSRDGVYKLLHRLGLSSLMPRPLHPESAPEEQESFKKNSSKRVRRVVTHP